MLSGNKIIISASNHFNTKKGESLLKFPNSYIVFDLETTDFQPAHGEIIEIAALKIVNNEVVDKFEELIKPEYSVGSETEKITGINNAMLEDKRSFPEVAKDFKDFIGNEILVAHNANFDINFMIEHCNRAALGGFDNDFVDTLRIARRLIKDIENHRLKTLLKYFEFEPNGEHRAMIDVLNTYKMYLELEKINDKNPYILKPKPKRNYGYNHNWKDLSKIEREVPLNEIDEDNFFYNKKVCFSCELLYFKKEYVAQTIADLGAEIQNSVTMKTNILILGDVNGQIEMYGDKSNKHLKAIDYIGRGLPLEIIDEEALKTKLNSLNDKEESSVLKIEPLSQVEKHSIDNDYSVSMDVPLTNKNTRKNIITPLNCFALAFISFIPLFFIDYDSSLYAILSLLVLASLFMAIIATIFSMVKKFKNRKNN